MIRGLQHRLVRVLQRRLAKTSYRRHAKRPPARPISCAEEQAPYSTARTRCTTEEPFEPATDSWPIVAMSQAWAWAAKVRFLRNFSGDLPRVVRSAFNCCSISAISAAPGAAQIGASASSLGAGRD